MTYKELRRYDLTILNKILECNKEAFKKYEQEGDLFHLRMVEKAIKKVEKVIKEKETN